MRRTSNGFGRRAERPGFTLVELLVVIAVIALLLMILTPCLRKARVVAGTVLCTSRLHDMGVAGATYINEQGPYMPRDYYTGMRDRYPIQVLIPEVFSQYMGGPDFRFEPLHPDVAAATGVDVLDKYYYFASEPAIDRDDYLAAVFKDMEALQCPAQPPGPHDPKAVTHPFSGDTVTIDRQPYSYVTNSFKYNGAPGTASAGITRVHLLEPRDKIAYLADGNVNLQWTYFGSHDLRGDHFQTTFADRLIDDGRHGGQAPIMFFDFHAEVIPLEDVTRLDLWTPE
jgi:prepilin-type N-terminal cleavage/methylation domain-containing protein/prepilin-type processing-associated H-X9-DG protein